MSNTRVLFAGVVAFGFALIFADSPVANSAQQSTGTAVAVDNDDIGGTVTSAKGPEAGVWVIAETRGLQTKLVKIVVTDDQGRYVVPDLPKATYNVWVRGYGLVDSPQGAKHARQGPQPESGRRAQRACRGGVLPGGLLVLAHRSAGQARVPRHRRQGNGISPTMRSQAEWLRSLKNGGCWGCHQLGNKATREIPEGARHLSLVGRRVGSTRAVRPGRRGR